MKAALFKVNSHKVCSKYELENKIAYFVFITQMHIYIYIRAMTLILTVRRNSPCRILPVSS